MNTPISPIITKNVICWLPVIAAKSVCMEIGAGKVFSVVIAPWPGKASFVMSASILRNAQIAPGAMTVLIA